MRKIIVNVLPREKRIAIIENGQAAEFYIDRPDRTFQAGNIYKGRVVDVLPGMEAAFIDIGDEKNAYLHVDDCQPSIESHKGKGKKSISQCVQEGQEIFVQIKKEAIGNKGARVTREISLAGRFGVFLPDNTYLGISRRIQKKEERERLEGIARSHLLPGEGMIMRTQAEGANEAEISEDLHFLRTRWLNAMEEGKGMSPPALIFQDFDILSRIARDLLNEEVDEVAVDDSQVRKHLYSLISPYHPDLGEKIRFYHLKVGIFSHYGLEAELEKALNRKIWLKNGGYLVIDQTEALTVFDVNSGKFTGTDDLERTVLKTNKEACVEIARQLRLRDLAGIILIDFIDMEKEENRQEVNEAMQKELWKDRTRTRLLGFTRLGLLEMTRKRVRQDLRESLTRECSCCEGKGRILSHETVEANLEREVREYARGTEIEAILVEAHPQTRNYLQEGDLVPRMEKDFAVTLKFKNQPALGEDQYRIAFLGSVEEVCERGEG